MRPLFFLLFLPLSAFSETLPAQLAQRYSDLDLTISDEFNTLNLDHEKWTYRTRNGDDWGVGKPFVNIIAQENISFLSLRGILSDEKGSGISTKSEAHFGFYSIRWRTINITPDKHTPWHPAIWMAPQNFASGENQRSLKKEYQRTLEIDLIEYWYQPVWHSQSIPWPKETQRGREASSQKLRPELTDFPNGKWQTHGLEYTPDYLQLWQELNGEWKPIGQRILFNDKPNSKTSLHREHATPGYWVISNKYHFENIKNNWAFRNGMDLAKFRMADSWLHLDFFRYHPLKSK